MDTLLSLVAGTIAVLADIATSDVAAACSISCVSIDIAAYDVAVPGSRSSVSIATSKDSAVSLMVITPLLYTSAKLSNNFPICIRPCYVTGGELKRC